MAVTTVTVAGWLVFDRRRIPRTHVKEPALERGEKAIRITLEIPAAAFREPALAATIRLDGKMPAELRAEAVAEVERALLEVPNVHVDLLRRDGGDRSGTAEHPMPRRHRPRRPIGFSQ